MNFVGLSSDTEFAKWLTEMLTMFVQKELKIYMWGNDLTSLAPKFKRPVIIGFVIGCCGRINARLKELIDASEVQASSNANALIVIKDALINVKIKELRLNLRTPRNRRSHIETDAYGAGKAAGDRANFSRPVGGSVGMLRIGSK